MLLNETMLTLDEAAERLPGHPSHVTLWRWCHKGIKGVRLEHRRLGRKILTSLEALDRFSAQLAQAHEVPEPSTVAKPTTKRANDAREMAWAQKVLAEHGIKLSA